MSVLVLCMLLIINTWSAAESVLDLPDDLIRIESRAFSNIDADVVCFPSSVTYIADDAFQGTNFSAIGEWGSYAETWCRNKGISFNTDSYLARQYTWEETEEGGIEITGYTGERTSVIIPQTINGKTVTELKKEVFKGQQIREISFPSTITSIGAYAFENCTSLEKVMLSDAITYIGRHAFRNCTALSSWNYPLHLEEIGSWQLIGEYGILNNCTSLKKITVPEGVTKLPGSIFEEATGLTEVNLPSTLTEIGSSAFYRCTSLKKANIPDSVTWIGMKAFKGCTALTEWHYPENLERVGWSLIEGTSGIFTDCTNLKTITVPNGITTLPEYMFFGANCVEEIYLPSSLTAIPNGAFYDCVSLKKLSTLSLTNVVTVGGQAFRNCSSLERLELPDTVKEIGYYAFKDCKNLRYWKFPPSLQKTGTASNNGYNFEGCESLTLISVPEGVTIIPRYCFLGSDYLKKVNLPSTLVLIETGAFAHCGKLSSVSLPAGLQKIETMAFQNCSSLTSITLPAGVILEGDPFDGCPVKDNLGL